MLSLCCKRYTPMCYRVIVDKEMQFEQQKEPQMAPSNSL